MKILVTGACGFIGTHLTQSLLGKGIEVIGLDNFSSYYSVEVKKENLRSILSLNSSSFTFYEGDVLSLVSSDLYGIDGIIHLAGQPGVRLSWGSDFNTYLRDNVLATQRLFEVNAGKIPIVYASSSSVYGNSKQFPLEETFHLKPVSPYGVTKATCEMLAEAYMAIDGGTYIGLRFFTVYGPRQRPDMAFTKIASSIYHQTKFPIFGDGNQIRDFTFVEDAVDGIFDLFSAGVSGVYNIGGGSQTTLLSAIRLFEEASGLNCPMEFLPSGQGDMYRTLSDNKKIYETCGWVSKTKIEDGIAEHWKWYELSGRDNLGVDL